MNYRVIGLMSGSSLDGLDIAYVHLEENAGRWSFSIKNTACVSYSAEWVARLAGANDLSARDYLLLHSEYGHLIGGFVRDFIQQNDLAYQVQFIASHGHTVFHMPEKKMTSQLGDGAAIAAESGLPVISELRSMDIARGGQGAPVVPIGEKLFFPEIQMFLNLGGIANISASVPVRTGFDVCPANRVLNGLATGLEDGFDRDGKTAASGRVDEGLLEKLNRLGYYAQPWPKSLANDFGVATVLPLLQEALLPLADALRTYAEHIVQQITRAAVALSLGLPAPDATGNADQQTKLLCTGGGAHNIFLVNRLRESLSAVRISLEVPEAAIVDYKEALVMALMGTLRWREETNVLASVTGASSDSINGAVYMP